MDQVQAARDEVSAAQGALMRGEWSPPPEDAQRLISAMHAQSAWLQAHDGTDLERAYDGWCAVLTTLKDDGLLDEVDARLGHLYRMYRAALADAADRDEREAAVYAVIASGGMLGAIATGDLEP